MKQNIKKRFTIHYEPPAMSQRGFTLIELAMALVVIGLLVGLGAALIGPLTKRAKLIETREIVNAAYESILGFAAKNKRLPNDLTVLGIKTTDAYMRDLRYFRVGELVTGNLCTTRGTYLIVNDASGGGTPPPKNNVAFILFGEGENRTNDTGTASPFTIKEQGVDDYDDIVRYVDIDKLRQQVCLAFRITTDSLPIGTEEMAYPSTTLEATDGTLPYTWSVVGQTQGTSGCTGTNYPIVSANTGLCMTTGGVISGTPIIDGSYNFTLEVKDSDSPQRIATKSLSITINPNKPRITTEFLHYGYVDEAYSATLSATGGLPAYKWSLASGSLPPGLSLSGAGVISGTPTTVGTYSFTPVITDSRLRTASKTLSLAINPAVVGPCPALSLTPSSGTIWSAIVGSSFSQSIAVSGGQTPYTNTRCEPSSCRGLRLSCTASGATISGIPTTSGTCTFNVAWRDSCPAGAQTISGVYTVNISLPPPPPPPPPPRPPGFGIR
jgi:prepilin-type N-terminal cleavage/methylation domain-containing protein